MKSFHTVGAAFLLATFFTWSSAQAATMTVDASAPDVVGVNGVCSLREAISAANGNSANADCPASGGFGNDVINLPAGTYTISLATACEDGNANGDYDIVMSGGAPGETLTITGAGAATTFIDGGDVDRVFDLIPITVSPTVTISGVTIRNGTARLCTGSGFSDGGGIRVQVGSLTLNDAVVSGNDAVNGGGIRNNGTLIVNRSTLSGNNANQASGGSGGGLSHNGPAATLTNATFSGNTAVVDGGGVASDGNTRLRNVTVTSNTANGDGGGFFMTSDAGTNDIRNTIIAGNTDASGGTVPDCGRAASGGDITSEGFNLIGNNDGCAFFGPATGDQLGTPASPINPQLGPLANNGGPTPTHLLLTGSRAIDLANDAGCFSNDANNGSPLTVDQRSFTRPLDGDGDGGVRCDVGAVEVGCGNGVVETGEGCDDGNTTAGDGCSGTCVLESCGDGTVQSPEVCDDGNTANGDGCNANCILETCGNGTVDAGEECDDDNSVNTDSCLNNCQDASCGDGFVETGAEECDDGNTNDGDGCSSTCTSVILLVGDGGCSLIR